MKHVTIKICTYKELSEAAKERARDWYCEGDTWHCQDEWWQSAQEFSAIAPIDIQAADYERAHVEFEWQADCDVADLKGVRAWKWLQNNGWFDLAARNVQGDCTLTGFCGDCSLFDPLHKYSASPLSVPDLRQVFYECAQSWIYDARLDLEASYSEEVVEENIIANEYEFTEHGKRWA